MTRNARPSLEFLSVENEIPDYEFVEPVISEVEQLITVYWIDITKSGPAAGTVGNTQHRRNGQ